MEWTLGEIEASIEFGDSSEYATVASWNTATDEHRYEEGFRVDRKFLRDWLGGLTGIQVRRVGLHLKLEKPKYLWAGEDLNLRRRMPTGLQPVPFGRSGTDPTAHHPTGPLGGFPTRIWSTGVR